MPNPSARRILQDQFRAIAQDRGCLWYRATMTAAGVDRIRAIPLPVLRYVVARADAQSSK